MLRNDPHVRAVSSLVEKWTAFNNNLESHEQQIVQPETEEEAMRAIGEVVEDSYRDVNKRARTLHRRYGLRIDGTSLEWLAPENEKAARRHPDFAIDLLSFLNRYWNLHFIAQAWNDAREQGKSAREAILIAQQESIRYARIVFPVVVANVRSYLYGAESSVDVIAAHARSGIALNVNFQGGFIYRDRAETDDHESRFLCEARTMALFTLQQDTGLIRMNAKGLSDVKRLPSRLVGAIKKREGRDKKTVQYIDLTPVHLLAETRSDRPVQKKSINIEQNINQQNVPPKRLDSTPDPIIVTLTNAEAERQLLRVKAALPPMQWQVYELTRLEWPVDKIAEHLGIKVKTVYQSRFRYRKTLDKLYETRNLD